MSPHPLLLLTLAALQAPAIGIGFGAWTLGATQDMRLSALAFGGTTILSGMAVLLVAGRKVQVVKQREIPIGGLQVGRKWKPGNDKPAVQMATDGALTREPVRPKQFLDAHEKAALRASADALSFAKLKPIKRARVQEMRAWLMSKGYAQWKNGNKLRGWELTLRGERMVR